ncbi:ATP-binding SpoIIE family protein phosphatase [Streptomyces coerulescens]|uniref:SpoIIE family protein phosphatase n=1 Tax=Streptomyces coerulescens TaxID=29304 RepID=A0ABW0CVA9_STRCD
MAQAAHSIAKILEDLSVGAVPLTPPVVPFVFSGHTVSPAALPWTSTDEAVTAYHLHKLALQLSSETTTERAAQRVMDRLVHGFRASGVAISLIEAGRLRLVGATGCADEYLRALSGAPLSRPSPETGTVSRCEQVVHTVDVGRDASRLSGTAAPGQNETWWVLPLLAADRVIGTCSVGYRWPHGEPVDQSPLTSLATLLGQTFHRTQVTDARRALAQKLQETLLPRVLHQTAGLASTCRYAPAAGALELGGDWYDLIEAPGSGIVAVVGDVEGHNTAAAVVMGELRSAIRAYATEGHTPTTILARTNKLLVDLSTGLFATCCVMSFDLDTGICEVALAGHPPPCIRTGDGAFVTPHADAGPPLGVHPDPAYRSAEAELTPDTLIAMFTGPLAEVSDGMDCDLFNTAVATSQGELETLGDLLIGAWGDRAPRTDDAALLVLRYEGPSAEAQRFIHHMEIPHHDLQGVSRARQFLHDCMSEWGLSELSDEAVLLASEVVTNALVHGDSDVDVRLRRYPSHVRVEVRDSTPQPAVPVTIPRDEDRAEGGRGLLIVEALAKAWGNSPSGRGKTVWFEMATDATASHHLSGMSRTSS